MVESSAASKLSMSRLNAVLKYRAVSVFLGHAFDDEREPIYVDEFHLDPRGNQIMADAIARVVRLGGGMQ